MSILRILVTGDTKFNNYFKAYPYLKELVPKNSIVVTCGTTGADEIGNLFAANEGLACETYPVDWDTYGKSAAKVRNYGVVKMSKYAIIFWDGVSENTKSLIDIANKKRTKPTIVEYTDKDIIKPHFGRVVNIHKSPYDIYCGRGSIYGNPFVMTSKNDRELVVMRYTDYLMRNEDLISAILKITPEQTLGCFCAPKLCHCDVISWVLDNAVDELKMLLVKLSKKKDANEITTEITPDIRQLYSSTASKFTTPGGLYSVHGIQVATDWSKLVYDGIKVFLEIPNSKILKKNLHLSREMIDIMEHSDEDNLPTIKYHTNEIKNIPVIYQQITFADSPYKEGCWYVDVLDVVMK